MCTARVLACDQCLHRLLKIERLFPAILNASYPSRHPLTVQIALSYIEGYPVLPVSPVGTSRKLLAVADRLRL